MSEGNTGAGGVAVAEAVRPRLSPFEQARALFEGMPAIDGEHPGRRVQNLSDGSRVCAIDKYGDGLQYDFLVTGPEEGDFKDSKVCLGFNSEGRGTIDLPGLKIMRGEEQVALAASTTNLSTISESAQDAMAGWVDSIIENDQYAPLGLAVAGV